MVERQPLKNGLDIRRERRDRRREQGDDDGGDPQLLEQVTDQIEHRRRDRGVEAGRDAVAADADDPLALQLRHDAAAFYNGTRYGRSRTRA